MKTVTGLFDYYDDARRAASKLEGIGIPKDNISVLANNADGTFDADSNAAEGAGTGAGLGAVAGGAGGLLAGLGLLAIPGIGPVVAAGWLAATAAGAAAGAVVGGATGGIIGAMTSAGVPERDAHLYAEGMRRGGTLVTARVVDDRFPEAQAILRDSNWVDTDERRRSYEAEGWQEFNPSLDALTADQIRRERERLSRL
ncbi:hypothetical protein JJB09_26080 [Rhizobium sp. KVB221]|uniref:General stress protein 17M-like domain-containing protein n=1 Tax=Rhizobium setariae TaxID=2801340 RepID=A0A936YX36_9HYPH|nr:hypothetical protein [Rhizobium setariae]MBL0375480.1 hypothetical protein [Rhizobium setariae]